MGSLDALRLERAMQAAGELAQISDLVEFPSRTAQLLRNLIPCDHAGYNAIEVPSGSATVIADPSDVVFDGGPEILVRLADQNPCIVRARNGDMDAMRLSDHISQHRFHRTDIYNYIYKVIELEHQLALQLPPLRRELGRRHEVIGLSLARSRSDFSDEDKDLLQLLQPVFTGTLQRLHDLALVRAVAADVDDPLHLVLLVDYAGTIAWTTAAAEELLDASVGHPLPGTLRRWIADTRWGDNQAEMSTTVAIFEHIFQVRFVRDAYPGLDALHLGSAACAPDAASLRALGLTQRQAQVLALALEGHDTHAIARQLGLSARTVDKHFEDLYGRLNVHSRSKAIAGVLKALGPWQASAKSQNGGTSGAS